MFNENCGGRGWQRGWARGAGRRGNWDAVFGPDGPLGPDGLFGGGRGGGGRGGNGRGNGRGRGRRGMFDRDELRLVLLCLIADEPRHGYDLIKVLEERSGGAYAPSPGVIYPTLALLADEGLIVEQPGDDQRRRFGLTANGEALLEEQGEQAARLLARIDELASKARRDRTPQIERAAANLFTAVAQRMGAGGSDDLPHDIAAILDEAAQRIERL